MLYAWIARGVLLCIVAWIAWAAWDVWTEIRAMEAWDDEEE
jgi:hypothetical protein